MTEAMTVGAAEGAGAEAGEEAGGRAGAEAAWVAVAAKVEEVVRAAASRIGQFWLGVHVKC